MTTPIFIFVYRGFARIPTKIYSPLHRQLCDKLTSLRHHTPPISFIHEHNTQSKINFDIFHFELLCLHAICFYKDVIYNSHRLYLYPHSSLM